MIDSLLALLRGESAQKTIWTADITYWLSGRRQDGSADPAWETEEGYLKLHQELGILPYYDYSHFWAGIPEYDRPITVTREQNGNHTRTRISTPVGDLTEESTYLPESSSTGIARHFVNSEAELDILAYLLEHRRLLPANLDDYPQRAARWYARNGLPAIALPRSPLPALCYEWTGIQNLTFLLMDCEEKITAILHQLALEDEDILNALCERQPPLVHFADNLSSENFTGFYDQYLRPDHQRRLQRLHAHNIRAAVHLDGVVKGLLPKLIATGFDAIEALTPQPAGDLTVAEMAEIAQHESVILWGGVPGAMFAPPFTWQDMEKHVRQTLETWQDRPFILGVADQVPPDGDITFCRKIAEILPN